MSTSQSAPSRIGSHGRTLIVACVALAAYLWLYDQCVRMPFVAFHAKAWPYYAIGRRLRPEIDQASMGVGEYRLPEKPAELFFCPANWLDRQFHPKRWADEKFILKMPPTAPGNRNLRNSL